jgi:hypothetical protein
LTLFNPPPNDTPRYVPGPGPVSADELTPLIGCYIYVWLKNRLMFWFCPSAVTEAYAAGHAWNGSRWAEIRLSLRMIRGFR